MNSNETGPRVAALLTCLLGGWLLLGLHAAGIHPMAALARLAASDGQLSAGYERLLSGSQSTLGWLLLPAAALAWRAESVYRRLRALLLSPGHAVFGIGLGLAALASAWAVQRWAFDGIPHVTDAITHLFQVKILAAGQLTAPLPALPEFFLHPHVAMTADGRWFSKYPPGHALLLLAGLKTGTLAWVVPAAHAAAALLVRRLLRSALGEPSARLGGLLFVASPLALLLGASFMSHTTWLAAFLAGLALLIPAVKNRRAAALRALGAGAGFGLAFFIRPQDTVFAAAATGLSAAILGWPALRSVLARLPWLLLGAAPFLIAQLAWNQAVYHRLLVVGYGFSQTGFLFPTFQAHYGLTDEFTLRDAGRLAFWTGMRFNKALFGWPTSLLFLPFALGARERRLALLLAASTVFFAGAYALYSYYGAEYEARYLYPLVPTCIGLSALGLRALRGDYARGLAAVAMLVGFAHAACFYLPRQLAPIYTRDYEYISPRLHEMAERAIAGRAVVLLEQGERTGFNYAAAFLYNDPWLTNRLIFAHDLGPRSPELRRVFPGRALLRFEPPDRFVPVE